MSHRAMADTPTFGFQRPTEGNPTYRDELAEENEQPHSTLNAHASNI